MAVAAFVISVLALVVSVLAALYARRQAHANESVAEIERDRRDDERAQAQQRRWRLISDRHRVFLVNEGPDVAHEVKLKGAGRLETLGTIEPHQKVPVRVVGRTARVTWHQTADPTSSEYRAVLTLNE